jgi:DNA-binding transcriptional MerR regulator
MVEPMGSFDTVDACTLPTAERPLRLAEFDDLFATAVRDVATLSPTHARMRLTGPTGLEARIRDLTARETECCSFFTFTVTPSPAVDGEVMTLDIEVPPEYADVLGALAGRAGPLDLAGLSARSGVPVERLNRYAETGLLAPARRDGDRLGYPPAEAGVMRLVAGAEQLGLDHDTLAALAGAWRDADCTTAHRQLADAVSARIDLVQAAIGEQNRRALDAGPGTPGWAEVIGGSASLSEHAGRLQAVAAALTTTAHDGPCGDGCGCATALAASGTAYRFPGAAALSCDLVADGGDVHDRIGVWQQVLGRVRGRDPLPDTTTGVALRFPLDVDLAGTLGRLAAAEYRCCSFGSYTLVVDGTGLRLELRMPAEAFETMAAVVGVPDRQEVGGAA